MGTVVSSLLVQTATENIGYAISEGMCPNVGLQDSWFLLISCSLCFIKTVYVLPAPSMNNVLGILSHWWIEEWKLLILVLCNIAIISS
jgi:hypothetical protein